MPSERARAPVRIVLLSPGLDEEMIWGETLVVRSAARRLAEVFPGATVLARGRNDLAEVTAFDPDLLISFYTGPSAPWRVDDVADRVGGITMLAVYNHGDLLDDFARVRVDGYITNSKPAVEVLGRARPTRWVPLAADDDFGPTPPDDRYRADVVYLGSGGRGNKRPATTRHYLEPAQCFDFALWGSWWQRDYWEPAYHDAPERNDWERCWRGKLPLDDVAPLYSSAKIVLNYHEDSQREWGMWNNRVFEVLACGALLISDDALGIREELGEGLVVTPGGEETARLIAYYLDRPAERQRIAAVGQRQVRERYGFRRWARQVAAFYDELRERRAAAPRAVAQDG
jgi:hypothetical protein